MSAWVGKHNRAVEPGWRPRQSKTQLQKQRLFPDPVAVVMMKFSPPFRYALKKSAWWGKTPSARIFGSYRVRNSAISVVRSQDPTGTRLANGVKMRTASG